MGWKQRRLAPLVAAKPPNTMGMEYLARAALTI